MNDGGPAFPHVSDEEHDSGYHATWVRPGMSLRDWFAGQACTGYLAAHADPGVTFPEVELLALWSFEMADAMLLHRGIWLDKPASPG